MSKTFRLFLAVLIGLALFAVLHAARAAPPVIIKYDNSGTLTTVRQISGGSTPVAAPTTPVTTMPQNRWIVRNDLFPPHAKGINFDDEIKTPWAGNFGLSGWPGMIGSGANGAVPAGEQGWRQTPDGAAGNLNPYCSGGPNYCYEQGSSEGSYAKAGHFAVGRNTGTFRTFCDFSHFAYDDPIVYPGQPGKSHLHAFFGNTGTGGNTTANDIANKGNSTCSGGTLNRTGYWVPAMIYHCPLAGLPAGCDPALDGTPIEPFTLNAYYKGNHGFGEFTFDGVQDLWVYHAEIVPFPQGFRMIGGFPTDTPDSYHNDGSVTTWTCRDFNESDGLKSAHGIPGTGVNPVDTICPSGSRKIVMNVGFYTCWNGVDLDSPGHNSHVASWVNLGSAGGLACPSTHPYQIPGLAELVHYQFDESRPGYRRTDMQFWRLSSDNYDDSKRAGYSGHGDDLFAWKAEVMDAMVKNILQPGVDGHNNILGAIPGTSPDSRGPPFNGYREMRTSPVFRSRNQ